MPPKIRKKSETGGLDQPDQVMTTLQTTYGFLDKYKYLIVGGFVGVVVLLLAVSWFVGYQEDKHKELAHTFFEAFKYVDAPVGEEAEALNGLEAFATHKAKYEKLQSEMTTFLEANGSSAIADTARLVLASSKMELGDYEGAYSLLQEFLESAPDSALAPLVLENLGYAALNLGKAEEAVKHFEAMKGATSNTYVVARALVHLGDLYNPSATGTAFEKDADKARKYYEEALSSLPPEEEDAADPDPAVVLTRQEIQLRLSLLQLG